ncbi:MAG: hypothetical protein J1F10_02375, partial [Muribaculaceae bacterium]|nr:hypothetical protein [Muribaculaceae bacterium]
MKKNKYFFLAIAFFLSQFSAFAQTFEIKYYLSDFTITAGADSVVTVTSKHRSFYGGDMQSPRLPFLSANILCSRGTVECNPTFS